MLGCGLKGWGQRLKGKYIKRKGNGLVTVHAGGEKQVLLQTPY